MVTLIDSPLALCVLAKSLRLAPFQAALVSPVLRDRARSRSKVNEVAPQTRNVNLRMFRRPGCGIATGEPRS